jgi:hypothetical protein
VNVYSRQTTENGKIQESLLTSGLYGVSEMLILRVSFLQVCNSSFDKRRSDRDTDYPAPPERLRTIRPELLVDGAKLPPFSSAFLAVESYKLYWNSSITISGFEPSRSGGPQVPAPLEVKTCIFPTRLKPYTNRR